MNQDWQELFTCETPVTPTSLLFVPALSSMVSITFISCRTSSLPDGFLTRQQQRDMPLIHNTFYSMRYKSILIQSVTHMDGKTRSLFSSSSSRVVYLLQQINNDDVSSNRLLYLKNLFGLWDSTIYFIFIV